ncbi:MAG: methyltransferase [Mogibacterium sp.]|nr:methyltransferase [Mogibacterium sp.]
MERIDDTGFGGIRVIQKKGSGYGVDAVLLAAFAAGETGAKGLPKGSAAPLRIADLGTGCGVAAFILHHKLSGALMTGYDISANAIDRAQRACIMNGLSEDMDFICTDINDIRASADFDAVITNPPYFRRTVNEPGAADPDERYVARHETTADISDFAAVSSGMLRDGGHLYMVHRPDRLADIFSAMRAAGIEPKDMQFVIPMTDKAANIVLIHGVKGAGSELRMLPQITVHTTDGGYTYEILKYYERV